MKNQAKAMGKRIAAIGLLLAVMLRPVKLITKRANEIIITEIKEHSVDTSKPLSSQRGSIQIINQTKYIGTFMTEWTDFIGYSTLKDQILYRKSSKSEILMTKIISFDLNYHNSPTYNQTSFTFSSNPETKNQLRLKENSISHHRIDQEVFIGRGEDLKSQFLLKAVIANLSKPDDFLYSNITQIEMYIKQKQNSKIIHILLDNLTKINQNRLNTEMVLLYSPVALLGYCFIVCSLVYSLEMVDKSQDVMKTMIGANVHILWYIFMLVYLFLSAINQVRWLVQCKS